MRLTEVLKVTGEAEVAVATGLRILLSEIFQYASLAAVLGVAELDHGLELGAVPAILFLKGFTVDLKLIRENFGPEQASSSHPLAGNIETLGKSLDNIVTKLEDLNSARDELPVYEARFQIDSLFRDDLNEFAEARESMVHVFGMQNYADVMSNFAAGERYINRVWSASTDGYVDEVRMYIERARDQFLEG